MQVPRWAIIAMMRIVFSFVLHRQKVFKVFLFFLFLLDKPELPHLRLFFSLIQVGGTVMDETRMSRKEKKEWQSAESEVKDPKNSS